MYVHIQAVIPRPVILWLFNRQKKSLCMWDQSCISVCAHILDVLVCDGPGSVSTSITDNLGMHRTEHTLPAGTERSRGAETGAWSSLGTKRCALVWLSGLTAIPCSQQKLQMQPNCVWPICRTVSHFHLACACVSHGTNMFYL